MWWYKHVIIIAIQLIAIIFYFVGSRKFYLGKKKFVVWIILGIVADTFMSLSPILLKLPRMEAHQCAPWSSPLFVVHVLCATLGMFWFIGMLVYLWIKGVDHYHGWLRRFQYKVMFRVWLFGVIIALVNFTAKIFWHVRIYDF